MLYEVLLAQEAVQDLKDLPAHLRSAVRDAMYARLCHEPERTSKSSVKRLRGISRPQYRLRVGTIRVFYDVEGSEVHVLAVVEKTRAGEWLKKAGVPS